MTDEWVWRLCWMTTDLVGALTWAATLALFLWRAVPAWRRWMIGAPLSFVSFVVFRFFLAGPGPDILMGRASMSDFAISVPDMVPSLAGCTLGHYLGHAILRRLSREDA